MNLKLSALTGPKLLTSLARDLSDTSLGTESSVPEQHIVDIPEWMQGKSWLER